ncbi:MAG TPA: DUF3147 family protein [Candidatus Binatia bacterium]|nr:DUF3147 family protein [Candidatus Binatia bacterium]
MPELAPGGLRKTKPSEYVIRFAFGGAITLCTGLIAHAFGPVVGGLFLAFPAILPASLTLAKEHDGRARAAEQARGAVLGAAGLAAFGLVAWRFSALSAPPLVLGLATVAWLAASVLAWLLVFGWQRRARAASRPAPA